MSSTSPWCGITPNLFANTPEADFLARKAEIEGRLAAESHVDFVLDLQRLAALAGDSHTQVSLNAVADQVRFYPVVLTWYDGHWYLTTAEQGQAELLGHGGHRHQWPFHGGGAGGLLHPAQRGQSRKAAAAVPAELQRGRPV